MRIAFSQFVAGKVPTTWLSFQDWKASNSCWLLLSQPPKGCPHSQHRLGCFKVQALQKVRPDHFFNSFLNPETSIYMGNDGNGCFIKHPFSTGCLGFQVYVLSCHNCHQFPWYHRQSPICALQYRTWEKITSSRRNGWRARYP